MGKSDDEITIQQCTKKNQIYMGWYDPVYHQAFVFKPRCWCWNCTTCARARAGYWAKRVYAVVTSKLESGEHWYFVTFTSHENCKNYTQTRYILRKNFHKLYKRMLRQKPDLMYIAIPEKHQDGRLHVHMLTNAPLRTKWYKDNARSCGFGYQARAYDIDSGAHAAFYVTKYLAKSLSVDEFKDKRFQRVRVSKSLPELENDDNFDKKPVFKIGSWVDLQAYIAKCHFEQCQCYYLETGERL